MGNGIDSTVNDWLRCGGMDGVKKERNISLRVYIDLDTDTYYYP